MQRQTLDLISIVIPVWNEEEGIPQLYRSLMRLRELLRKRGNLEFIFVDDGSSDNTQEKIRQQFGTGENYCIVPHGHNQGIGCAFRSGFKAARGTIICTIDADCTYSPEGLKSLIDALDGSGSDIAVASPYHPQGKVEGVAFWRLLVSKCCSWFYRRLAPVHLYTYTSIFRAYRRHVTETVSFHGTGFVCAAEILVRAGQKGYRIVEVPMTLHSRQIGQSKMKVLRTTRAHLRMMKSLVTGAVTSNRSNSVKKAVALEFSEPVLAKRAGR